MRGQPGEERGLVGSVSAPDHPHVLGLGHVTPPTQSHVTLPTQSHVTLPTQRHVTLPTQSHVTLPTQSHVTLPTQRHVTPPTQRHVPPHTLVSRQQTAQRTEMTLNLEIPTNELAVMTMIATGLWVIWTKKMKGK